ncbi:MAG: carbohydrate ABC transporter permease, partial [Anaerolineae bacterium]|nr:carbohydrate ABC transporter permease [Anaerolineae bacterium]
MATIETKSAAPVAAPTRTILEMNWQRRQGMRALIYHLFVGAAALLMLYPILWLVGSSFKAPDEIWTNQVALIPNHLYADNYANGWAGFGGITFTTFYQNSFTYAILGTIINVCASTIVA